MNNLTAEDDPLESGIPQGPRPACGHEVEERYGLLFASMSEGVALHEILCDAAGRAADYRILDVNPAFTTLTGIERQAAAGRKASQVYGIAPPPFLETYARVAESGKAESFEADFPPPNRHFRVSVFRPAQGRFATVFADITESKRAQAELQNMLKLQSVGTLAGGIAHDFNNILQGLYGNISLAKEDLSKTHPSYALLEDAEKSMTRAIWLTKQLLTFARGGDPVKESVSLGATVGEVARFDLTGSSVSLVYRQAEDLWPVVADKSQIEQAVSNLVINARQAMSKGGHLYLTLENADLPAEAIPTLGQGRYVKVSIRDEGCGIEPKVIAKIFDPYFKIKQTGSGLGLATVWSIINKHGGHIGVVSELGKGATFTFYLPASASPQSAEA